MMAGEKTMEATLQDTMDKLWDTDPVRVSEAGCYKLLDVLETAAGELLNSPRGKANKCKDQQSREVARVVGT
jgi:hypothetical protein